MAERQWSGRKSALMMFTSLIALSLAFGFGVVRGRSSVERDMSPEASVLDSIGSPQSIQADERQDREQRKARARREAAHVPRWHVVNMRDVISIPAEMEAVIRERDGCIVLPGTLLQPLRVPPNEKQMAVVIKDDADASGHETLFLPACPVGMRFADSIVLYETYEERYQAERAEDAARKRFVDEARKVDMQ